MDVGDKVVIVKSPYKSVKVGTIATIKENYRHMFGTKYNVYVLEEIKNRYFKEYELALLAIPEAEVVDENI